MKKPLMWSSVALAAVLAACSSPSDNDGGSKFCTGDSECATGSICHPTARLCVQTCTSSSDCPMGAKACNPVVAGSSTNVCQCTTSNLCATDTAGTICAAYDQICVAKCASSADCPNGRTCDTASGDCAPPGGNNDGGMDAGTPCTDQGQCGNDVCDFTTGYCAAGATCSTTNAQPDTCSYGQACFQGDVCGEMGGPTCGNFMSGSGALSWAPASDNGPVIYVAQDDATDDIAFCTSGSYAHTVHLYAYWTQAWPSSSANAPGPKYVSSTGTETAAGFRPTSGYTASGYDVDFKITLCAMTASPITAGFYFTGGNGFCLTTNGGTLMP